eukprot:11633489-Karenia_brevis.AAC.1
MSLRLRQPTLQDMKDKVEGPQRVSDAELGTVRSPMIRRCNQSVLRKIFCKQCMVDVMSKSGMLQLFAKSF